MIEIAARIVAVASLGWFTWGAYGRLAGGLDWFVVLIAIDHTLNVLFLLLARLPRAVDRRPHVVAITVAVISYTAFIDLGGRRALLPAVILYAIMGAGLVFEIAAKVWLGRSFGLVPANRGLVDGGPYRLVRHPIYSGYLLLQLGFALAYSTPRNLAQYALLIALVAARIVFEERLLSRDPAYRAYSARTRYRLLPGVW